MESNCEGSHRFFVAETGIDAEGKIVIILVCTACGEGIKREFAVAGSYTKKDK
jgi:hypothetical protein